MQLVDLRPDHLALVHEILHRFVPKAEVSVFGSRAKWLARETSDLDLCIREAEPLGFKRMGLLKEALEESNLPYKVDVVDWATTSESFRKIIERDKVVVQKAGGGKSAEWGNESTIGQLIADFGGSIKTGPFGTMLKASEYVSEGVPLISVREIGHGSFHVDSKTPRVSPETTARLSEYLLEAGDIVFARKGGIERCSLVRKAQAGWFLGSDGIRLRPPKNCDARFLAYSLQTQTVKDWLTQHSTGSTMASLNQATIARLPICIPAIDEQKKIANCLDALDDRITLLRETNATLEAIAQALFKSWFVDFDPVHAKQQGRAPEGMDEATAALFPDSFEESELGLLPKGWRVGALGDIAVTARKQLQPSELHSELHYVGLEHIPRKSLSLSDWDNAAGLESAKAAFSKGDILFGKLRPYFHKVVIAPFDGVCSTDILVCQPKKPVYYGITAMHLFSTALIDYAERLSNGAKMPRVSWKDLAAYPISIPPEALAEHFCKAISPLILRMTANVHQAQTLATLRDTLLPPLISGQLRLPEAEAMSTEAA